MVLPQGPREGVEGLPGAQQGAVALTAERNTALRARAEQLQQEGILLSSEDTA